MTDLVFKQDEDVPLHVLMGIIYFMLKMSTQKTLLIK